MSCGGTLASTAFYSVSDCAHIHALRSLPAGFRELSTPHLAACCLSVTAGQNLGRLGTKIASGGKDDGYERGQKRR